MALTVATLALGGAVFLGTLSLREAIRGTFDHLFGTLIRFDGTVRLAEPVPAAELERLAAAVPGVARAEAWSVARAAVRGDDGLVGAPLALTFVPPETPLLAFPIEAGRWLRAGDERAVVVGRGARERQPGLAVGSEVALVVGGRTTRWRVVGIATSGPGAILSAPRAALPAIGRGPGDADTVVVAGTSDDGVAGGAGDAAERGGALVRRVRAELAANGFAVDSARAVEAERRMIEDHLLLVVSFLMVMAQLAIVVGALGLASTMSLAVLERTRELGVMRALGASHGILHGLVQVEGLVVALLAWAVAVPLSVPMSLLLAERFARVFLPVAPHWAPGPAAVFTWLGVSVGASVVACAWPAWRATRVPAARALAYE
jgi:putative ABC transport system permease protein